MRIKTSAMILLLGPLLMLAMNCAKKPIVPESEFDTVISHYDQGMRELQSGRMDRARWEFERAMGIDRRDPHPYVGIALVECKSGNFKEAMEHAEEALEKDQKFVPAYIAMARIRTKHKDKDKDWYKKALTDLKKAGEFEPRNAEIYYVEGWVHEQAFVIEPAAAAFKKVLDLKSGYEKEADHEWKKIQDIQRAAPGTKIGIKIGLVDEITRAETAVLFIEELKLIELLEKREKKVYDTGFKAPEDPRQMKEQEAATAKKATDIDSHWAQNYIETVIGLDVRALGILPDNTYRPDDHLTRAEYALVVEDLLVKLLGNEELPTKYIGQPSPFPDVGNAHFAYNAIQVCVDKGIMKADLKDNSFRPNDTVSGAEALLIVQALRRELKQVF